MGNLTQLAAYDFSHNSLTGTLPDDWLASRQLRIVDVSNNQLQGSLVGAQAGSDLYGADCAPLPLAAALADYTTLAGGCCLDAACGARWVDACFNLNPCQLS